MTEVSEGLDEHTSPHTVLPCRAVLIDCDGVLVDSLGSVDRAWIRWARDHGLDPDDVIQRVHGRRAADTVASLIDDGRRAEALALINRYELEDAPSVGPVPGAPELVRSLPASRWALVTSGTADLAGARLAAAGIPLPGVVITADDVDEGKPAPDGYLAAARLLGVTPSETAVIEDSAAGVRAARAAGVGWVLGVGHGMVAASSAARAAAPGAHQAGEGDAARPGGAAGPGADVAVADLRGVVWRDNALSVPAAAD